MASVSWRLNKHHHAYHVLRRRLRPAARRVMASVSRALRRARRRPTPGHLISLMPRVIVTRFIPHRHLSNQRHGRRVGVLISIAERPIKLSMRERAQPCAACLRQSSASRD